MNEVIDLIDIDKINKSIETMQKSLIEHNEDTIYGYGYLALINKLDGFKTNMNMMYDEINCLQEKINKAIEYKEVIFKIKMIISARIKEYQKKIDNEIDMGSQGDHFKICRYEENIKFLKDILKEVE